jgi:hypothetical protein
MSKTMKKQKTELEKQQELGQRLQEFYDLGYVNRRRSLGFSFLKGLASGAGVFIGGTLVITLFVWMLSLFDQVPFLDGLIRAIKSSLERN